MIALAVWSAVLRWYLVWLLLISLFTKTQAQVIVPFMPGAGIGVDGPWPYISLPVCTYLNF